ncbi:hypothetical protein Egran_03012 [Elaphomyces granulatus]|uniref:Diaminohydroxyphosphoribosylamino-pyrimidine deaminase n=1 Tax=Elaphomyces granulatus TaxID=519963 RepID=A0A232LYS4_9EURO|nr:hypothetical protein Egran_03012 [Elaphomyces granulatus]
MLLEKFFAFIGEEVIDEEEESFILFSRNIPSANLGFVDSRSTTVDVTIHGRDFSIRQSPTLLSSTRAGGTTGAVLWKITPNFAEWISSKSNNPLWEYSILKSSATIVELGCGISGLVALTLAPLVTRYIVTDQEYVRKLLMENLETNGPTAVESHHRHDLPSSHQRKKQRKSHQISPSTQLARTRGKHAPTDGNDIPTAPANITFTTLDWELDAPRMLKNAVNQTKTRSKAKEHRHAIGQDSMEGVDEGEENDLGFDLLISCDCIYNEALVPPFVRTCVDICRLRPAYDPSICLSPPPSGTTKLPQESSTATVVLIAQQQRSPEVFETWLREALRDFHVWRLKDEVLGKGLMAGTGYVVHAMVLRRQTERKVD